MIKVKNIWSGANYRNPVSRKKSPIREVHYSIFDALSRAEEWCKKPTKVLNFGCGYDRFTKPYLEERYDGFQVDNYDPLVHKHCDYTIEEDLPSNTYTIVLAIAVLDRLPPRLRNEALETIKRVSKQYSLLIVSIREYNYSGEGITKLKDGSIIERRSVRFWTEKLRVYYDRVYSYRVSNHTSFLFGENA